MSGPSKVIVVDPDPRAARQIQLGFAREGVPTRVLGVPADAARLAFAPDDEPGLVVVGGSDARALELVRRARTMIDASHADAPLVLAARGVARDAALAAGADEILMRPAYLRDLVTVGRILRGLPRDQREHLTGNLVETTGVYTLVRALAALGRSAVLTLIRGLRRGEIRFYQGEVTSAQVGLIHGQAALHQLLLWTDARFDYQHEDIVRRHQIPLSSDELFADAERFLEGVRESAGELSPAMVLEQDVQRAHDLGKQVPTEVHGVLRMFDGHRVLADVLEDSPYRVFETLRVARKALELGLLREVQTQRAKATWRAVLALEEWLVGESREAVVERNAQHAADTPDPDTRKTRKARRTSPPPAKDFDWGALVPRVIGAEIGPLSGVVPATLAAGEIEIASRGKQREGLEALMDTDKRDRIFPTDVGLEPSVVVPEAEGPRAADSGPRPAKTTDAKALVAQLVADAAAIADTPPSGFELAAAAASAGPPAEPRSPRSEAPASVPPEPSPSDGVVRAMIALPDSAETTRAREARAANPVPEVPPLPDATGEIARPTPMPAPEAAAPAEPSILVSDLAAAHAAVAAVLGAPPPPAAPPGDAATPARELAVAEVRRDAVAFSETEEAFFKRADHTGAHLLQVKPESFDDLDEGYEPPKFWDRVFGRRQRRPSEGLPDKPKK